MSELSEGSDRYRRYHDRAVDTLRNDIREYRIRRYREQVERVKSGVEPHDNDYVYLDSRLEEAYRTLEEKAAAAVQALIELYEAEGDLNHIRQEIEKSLMTKTECRAIGSGVLHMTQTTPPDHAA